MTKYGDVIISLEVQEVSLPTVGANQILIKTHSASFNPIDYKILRGDFKAMGKIQFPNAGEILKDINEWVVKEEKLEDPIQMIDFQTEYTKDLYSASDYPKIDFELIRKHFKDWEHHKEADIMTYRNQSFSSPVTGTEAPIHHTPWAKAMDDSMEAFLAT